MREVFTRSFWEGVKKTFDQALEGPPLGDKAVQIKTEDDPSPSSTSETPSPPSVSSERR